MVKRQKATARLTPWKPTATPVSGAVRLLAGGGLMRIGATRTMVSGTGMGCGLSVLPVGRGAGCGLWTGPFSLAQGQTPPSPPQPQSQVAALVWEGAVAVATGNT